MPQSQNLVQENEEKKLEERLEVLSDRLENLLAGKIRRSRRHQRGRLRKNSILSGFSTARC